ncbi:YjcZ family sporulation protein [Bacillus sp. ISL-7]|nr:YjcZ family sporulation protein [Bacillus sp. ISL-7]MBT2737308.1 YjcZ family sporulation protein [Bacillus sp. ISL-7]
MIVVLFIPLIIVGSSFVGRRYY